MVGFKECPEGQAGRVQVLNPEENRGTLSPGEARVLMRDRPMKNGRRFLPLYRAGPWRGTHP